jgi:hypothetical protein
VHEALSYQCMRAEATSLLLTAQVVSRGRAKDLAEVGEFLEGQPEAAAYASLLSDDKTAADVMLLKVLGQIAAVALVSLHTTDIYIHLYINTCVCVCVCAI